MGKSAELGADILSCLSWVLFCSFVLVSFWFFGECEDCSLLIEKSPGIPIGVGTRASR